MSLFFSLHGVYDFIIKTFLTSGCTTYIRIRFLAADFGKKTCNGIPSTTMYHKHLNLTIHDLKRMHTMLEKVCVVVGMYPL